MAVNIHNLLLDAGAGDFEEKILHRAEYVRAPFAYAGGKSKSLQRIIPHLPYKKSYIEPFGGSAAILLARHESELEVYNDRYGGVCAFYRCIKDAEKLERLKEWIELSLHGREDFMDCKNTWEDCADDVERAAKWYYMMQTSFSSLGRCFGRGTSGGSQAAKKMEKHIADFEKLHRRIRYVLIENQDWRAIVKDFDNPNAVFYIDPPYLTAHPATYKYELLKDDHIELLETIMKMEGFVALSGYPNELYDSYKWDNRFEWEQNVMIAGNAFTKENCKDETHIKDKKAKEVLWIKEA